MEDEGLTVEISIQSASTHIIVQLHPAEERRV